MAIKDCSTFFRARTILEPQIFFHVLYRTFVVSDGNKGLLYILQSSNNTGTSDFFSCLIQDICCGGESYPSVEIPSVYSATPTNCTKKEKKETNKQSCESFSRSEIILIITIVINGLNKEEFKREAQEPTILCEFAIQTDKK